jgi:putative endonuclease
MTSKMQTGNEGEHAAAEYLKSKGYSVVERNYRYSRAEVDLIVTKGNWLVFVEVKTRTRSDFGFPEEFVDRVKEELILMAAENYIYEIDWQGNVRYDIVAVLGVGVRWEIMHFEDAFY